MNTKAGGSAYVQVNSEWVYPDDPSIDLAVLPWAPDPSVFDYKHLEPSNLLDDAFLEEQVVGPGDELAIVGLFTERHGKERNLPIVRSGTIAAMPGEPLFDAETGQAYPAYIAEVRSLGGLSGSPVFLALEAGRVHPKTNTIVLTRAIRLLGLVRGHWDYQTKKAERDSFRDERETVNMGMALVTPINEFFKLLTAGRLADMRAEFSRVKELEDQSASGSP